MTMKQVCIQVDRLISTKRLGNKGTCISSNYLYIFKAFKWTLSTETLTKLENRHAVLVRLKEDNSKFE